MATSSTFVFGLNYFYHLQYTCPFEVIVIALPCWYVDCIDIAFSASFSYKISIIHLVLVIAQVFSH